MTALEKINMLRKEATRLSGIVEIEDKEYRKLFWGKPARKTICSSSSTYKSSRKR